MVSQLLKAQLPLPLLPSSTLSLMPLALVTYWTLLGRMYLSTGHPEKEKESHPGEADSA